MRYITTHIVRWLCPKAVAEIEDGIRMNYIERGVVMVDRYNRLSDNANCLQEGYPPLANMLKVEELAYIKNCKGGQCEKLVLERSDRGW